MDRSNSSDADVTGKVQCGKRTCNYGSIMRRNHCACGSLVARWLVFHCHPSFSISHLIKLQLGVVQLRK